MLRALGRPALPVLLAFGVCTLSAHAGPISVSDNQNGGGSALYGDTIVRITSTSFQTNNSFDYGSIQETPGVSSTSSGVSAFAGHVSGAPVNDSTIPAGLQLAGGSVINMGNNYIDIQVYAAAGDAHEGGDEAGAAPNPEPGAIALFLIGGIGLAGYAWRVHRQSRQIA
jgi:hypothetical protein